MKEIEFERHLRQFSRLLEQEKISLIKNQAEKLEEIVEKKTKFVPIFEGYEGVLSQKCKQLIFTIKEQQQTNLLLTEQAISYQEMLMTAVKQNIQSPAGTYAKQTETMSPPVSIIDQEM